MPQELISNGQTGLAVRNSINSNFTDLFGAILPTERLTGSRINLPPGTYELDSSGAAFSLTLANTIGAWHFFNSNRSLSTHNVTVGGVGQTYTNPAGVQTLGPFVMDMPIRVSFIKTELGPVYRVTVDETGSGNVVSPDTNTFIEVVDGQITFTADGNPLGSMSWDTDLGMPKFTWPGALDPIFYHGIPQTIAQRNALVVNSPLLKAGYLVYVVDVGIDQWQYWTGSAWTPVAPPGGSSSKVVETLTIASRNNINNLGSLPTSPVEFHVNGVLARTGITNVNQAVTVNAVALGFNIDPPIDSVVAVYNI